MTTAFFTAARISIIACSATESELDPGACTTAMPSSVAAGRSTVSRPTPYRPTTFRFGHACMRERLQRGFMMNRMPAASRATESMPGSVASPVTATRASDSRSAIPSR